MDTRLKTTNAEKQVLSTNTAPNGSTRKQMAIGELPEDWGTTTLDELTTAIGDGIHATPKYSDYGEYFFINGNNIRDGRVIITEDTRTVDNSEYKKYRKPLGPNTVLLSINGTIGSLALYNEELVVLGKSAAYLNVKVDTDRLYLYYSLQTDNVAQQFDDGLTGTTIRNLGLGTIRRTRIPHPPLPEQEAIAEALADVDALLAALDKLIAKKRAIKQAAMQQLLTGKTRLPGFEGRTSAYKQTEIGTVPADWLVIPLGEVVAKFVNGGTPSTLNESYWKGDIPWITGADILNQRVGEIRRYITHEAVLNSSTNVVQVGNLLLVSRTGVGKLAIAPFDIAISQDFTGVYPIRDRLSVEYLFRYLDLNRSLLMSQNQGTSIMGITRETLSALIIAIPPTVEEQAAIATIIFDMDAEITTFEQRRDKTQQIKQGMMQQLLTGRIRLVDPATAGASV